MTTGTQVYECPECGAEVKMTKKPAGGEEPDAPICGCGAQMESEEQERNL